MFAIFLPIFIIAIAIVVDVGYWWANAKKAQIAADACALAAAGNRELGDFPKPYNPTHRNFGSRRIRVRAHESSRAGRPRQGRTARRTTVKSPYKGQEKYVEAMVR